MEDRLIGGFAESSQEQLIEASIRPQTLADYLGQKEVKEKDLADAENRKVLSFLMLEHKLGISLSELARTVKKETKDGVVPARPKPELYVEAA